MEFAQLETFFVVLIIICGAIISLAGACAAVVKFWRYAHKDTDKNTEEIESLKEAYEDAKEEYKIWFASDKRRIENLEGDFDEIIEQNNLMMTAVVALMDSQIDGDNIEKLQGVRNEVVAYLITSKTKKKARGRETQ